MTETKSHGDFDDEETLTVQFKKAEDVINDIGNGRFSAMDLQTRISEAVSILEKLTHAVSTLGLFSDNEEVEDLATSSIPFLLIPCYLGVAHHNTTTEPSHRADQLQLAKVYYRDFLKRLRSYGFEFERDYFFVEGGHEEGTDASRSGIKKFTGEELRELKIARYRKQQELKKTMSELKKQLEQNNGDESLLRSLHLAVVKYWQEKVIEELESIEDELPLVEMMKKRMQENSNGSATSNRPLQKSDTKPAPLRPFIITRTEQQKAVFGLGYPSIPTMTVDEWYNQRFGSASTTSQQQQQHHQPDDSDSKVNPSGGLEEEEAEERERARLMRWDEYKDDHRRGWGNTHNKG
ncbi:TAP42-like family protein [Ostertagia ostertagi]